MLLIGVSVIIIIIVLVVLFSKKNTINKPESISKPISNDKLCTQMPCSSNKNCFKDSNNNYFPINNGKVEWTSTSKDVSICNQ